MTREFKVGDEVEVYNDTAFRNGRVVAILSYPHLNYPIVVEHDTFDGTPGFKTSNLKTYQCFNYDGVVSTPRRQVNLRHKARTIIRNVYSSREGTFGPEWETEEEASKYRDGTCVGFFRARECNGNLSDIEYISLK